MVQWSDQCKFEAKELGRVVVFNGTVVGTNW